MNLSVSPLNNNIKAYNTSFGMAKFSKTGRLLAESCGDTYTPLKTPNKYQNPAFYKKKPLIGHTPFYKYMQDKLSVKKENFDKSISEISRTIVDCGTSDNSHTNALFIRQLLTTCKLIDGIETEKHHNAISNAILKVFDKNYDNPELTKEETQSLFEMGNDDISDEDFAMITGVITKSDM